MKKLSMALLTVLAFASAAAAQSAPATATAGKILYDTEGKYIGAIYKVTPNGSPQIILNDQQLVTVPAATLSQQGSKLTTSLTKREVIKLK